MKFRQEGEGESVARGVEEGAGNFEERNTLPAKLSYGIYM